MPFDATSTTPPPVASPTWYLPPPTASDARWVETLRRLWLAPPRYNPARASARAVLLRVFQGRPNMLRKIREDVARPKAWLQHAYVGGMGSHCLVGWILHDVRQYFFFPNVIEAVRLNERALIDFNDDPQTRQADVVSLLDEVIAEVGKEHHAAPYRSYLLADVMEETGHAV